MRFSCLFHCTWPWLVLCALTNAQEVKDDVQQPSPANQNDTIELRASYPLVHNRQFASSDQVFSTFQRGNAYKSLLSHLRQSAERDESKSPRARAKEALILKARLEDFKDLEGLATGVLQLYNNVVEHHMTSDPEGWSNDAKEHSLRHDVDYKSESIRLLANFQLSVKRRAHMLDRMDDADLDDTIEEPMADEDGEEGAKTSSLDPLQSHPVAGNDKAIEALIDNVLSEVRHQADKLEQGMHKKNPFSEGQAHEGAILETVVKVGGEGGDGAQHGGNAALDKNVRGKEAANEGELVTLIDQDNNQYILTRPFDTTVFYEDVRFIHDLILIVIVSFGLGWVLNALGLPAFFGYILAGVALGPSGYNLIQELIQTETLAQLGVVFIVFVLGIEFSIDKLRSMWRVAFGGAILILLASVLLFVAGGLLLGASMNEAIFIGACVSLSSTAVVVKCVKLEELEHMYGLLIMQDVLLGLMLAVMPTLTKSGFEIFFAVCRTLLSLVLFGAISFALSRALHYGVPWILRRILPKTVEQSHELLLLGTIATCLLMLVISENLGLGMELGCFVGGLLVRSRKTMFEASILVIEPVRDLFACLFFASIGLHVYPSFLMSESILLLTLTAAVVGFKYVITCIILVLFQFDIAKSSIMAIGMAQISEFAFVLASRAKQLGIITREVYYLLLAVTSLTLLVTPIVWNIILSRTGGSVGAGLHGPSESSRHGRHSTPPTMLRHIRQRSRNIVHPGWIERDDWNASGANGHLLVTIPNDEEGKMS